MTAHCGLNAIQRTTAALDQVDIDDNLTQNLLHENTAQKKAKTFVGRMDLRIEISLFYNLQNVKSSTMVVAGEPGNGKTSLMAYISAKCIKFLRPNNDFVFVHSVGSSLGSNSLENMLRRLHENLCQHTGKAYNIPTNTTELKAVHVAQLEEIARENPDLKFVILIDAVNQFSHTMQSQSMWWLPSRKAPKNLRVIISTLMYDGDTLENSLRRCPGALIVEVPAMSKKDCKLMVSNLLKKHDLEITVDDSDSEVGNQMEYLLGKSHSPLFLNAAIEGFHTKWIFEKESTQRCAYTTYIQNLPPTSTELFEFLLRSWEGDHGIDLIKWLMTILALLKDGLQKTMVEDIIAYVKETTGITFKDTLDNALNSVRGFLSCGGESYLKFFHEELTRVVVEKYDRRQFLSEAHDMLINFLLHHIQPQLLEHSATKPAYYQDCLSFIVYLETSLSKIRNFHIRRPYMTTPPQNDTYKHTLKTIFFIKERIALNQEKELLQEYRDTAEVRMGENEREAISEWQRFTMFHWPYVKKFPEWSYAFASNQLNHSNVAMDTHALQRPDSDRKFPLMWLNKPSGEMATDNTLRCVDEFCWSCDASSSKQNVCAFGGNGGKAFICNQTTGEVIHQVKHPPGDSSIMSVHLSPNCETLWIGNNHGKISVWDVRTGEQESDVLKVGEGHVIMIDHVSESVVVCGMGSKYEYDTVGTIALINTTEYTIMRRWSTILECTSYCYHPPTGVIVSGHGGDVICWNMSDGSQVNMFEVGRYHIPGMCAHKELPLVLLVTPTQFYGEVKTLNITTGECKTVIPKTGRWIAQFDYSYDHIICTCVNHKTIKIYTMDGVEVKTVQIHAGHVHNISALPYSNSFLSAAIDSGKLYTYSSSTHVEEPRDVIMWCSVLPNKEELVTLNGEGDVCVWEVSSLTLRSNILVKFNTVGRCAAVHPTGEFLVVCTMKEICVVDLDDIKMTYICRTPDFKHSSIMCTQFSTSGDKCIIVTYNHGTHVYKVHGKHLFEHQLTFAEMKKHVWWCDVRERLCVSGGNEGIVLWNIDTGATIQVLRTHWCRYVKFLEQQQRILYHVWEAEEDGKNDQICIMDMQGQDIIIFDTTVNPNFPKLGVFKTFIITAESDGSLRVHDIESGTILYVFVDENSLGFNDFVENPITKTICCYNGSGKCYEFEVTL